MYIYTYSTVCSPSVNKYTCLHGFHVTVFTFFKEFKHGFVLKVSTRFREF